MKEVNEMNIKEMVEKINGMPTVLVKVNLGDVERHDRIVAKPAIYHDEGYATIYRYVGPRDWNEWAEVRDDNRDGEKVVESTLMGPIPGSRVAGAVVNSVTPYETDLDTMPIRELPLWAKELWVKHRETFLPSGRGEVKMNARMIAQMNDLIEAERREGGLNPMDMTQEMQARYLRLWYSASAIDRIAGSVPDVEDLEALKEHVRILGGIVPSIRELPWRNRGNLDPESQFDREDIYETLVEVMKEATDSIGRIMDILIRTGKEKEGNGGQ